MENENKSLTVILIALAAVAGGLGIVFSVGMAIQTATAPMSGYLREIADGQKRVEAVLVKSSKVDISALEIRVASLEKELRNLKDRPQPVPAARPADAQAENLDKVYDIPVGDSAVLGPKDAPVTITVFDDYQCPFCGKFYPAAVDGQKAFPDKVRLVVKHYPLPFHNMARPAAKAALAAAEQGKFFEMSDLIFANAASLSNDKFKELAGKAGLKVDQFLKDLKDKDAAYDKKIQDDIDLGGKVDVRGTPTYYLNGKKNNARTADAWKAEISAVLKK
ncbi:MAG: thioredoxin domain-containing protein [Candidatus Omnitrophica bacterium]|nr:thioredoxin domain-containing protein [Candidatus Omnitrophota bacterium]